MAIWYFFACATPSGPTIRCSRSALSCASFIVSAFSFKSGATSPHCLPKIATPAALRLTPSVYEAIVLSDSSMSCCAGLSCPLAPRVSMPKFANASPPFASCRERIRAAFVYVSVEIPRLFSATPSTLALSVVMPRDFDILATSPFQLTVESIASLNILPPASTAVAAMKAFFTPSTVLFSFSKWSFIWPVDDSTAPTALFRPSSSPLIDATIWTVTWLLSPTAVTSPEFRSKCRFRAQHLRELLLCDFSRPEVVSGRWLCFSVERNLYAGEATHHVDERRGAVPVLEQPHHVVQIQIADGRVGPSGSLDNAPVKLVPVQLCGLLASPAEASPLSRREYSTRRANSAPTWLISRSSSSCSSVRSG